MQQPITSPIFGTGVIRNAGTKLRFMEFSEPGYPRLLLWPDGHYRINGEYGQWFGGKISDIDDTVAEVKRLAGEVGQ